MFLIAKYRWLLSPVILAVSTPQARSNLRLATELDFRFYYAAYRVPTEGWMIYAILVVGSLGGVTGPAVQGLVSRGAGADEQGGVQGSLTSLASVAGIIGPPIAAKLFGYFIGERAVIYLPGAAFFFSATLMVVALVLALRSFRRRGINAAVSSAPASSAVPH